MCFGALNPLFHIEFAIRRRKPRRGLLLFRIAVDVIL
jgi:hypothetical protein